MAIQTEKSKLLSGYLASAFILVGFCASAVAAQALETRIPDFELCFLRYITQFLLSILMLFFYKDGYKWSIEEIPQMLGICFTSMIYTVFFFHGIAILPLTDSYAFFALTSTVALALFTRFYQDKDLGLFHHISVALGALGCILIVQPWHTFSSGFIPTFMKSDSSDSPAELQKRTFPNTSEHLVNSPIQNINAGWVAGLGYLLIAIAGINESLSFMIVGTLKATTPTAMSVVGSFICAFPALLLSFYMETPVLITDPKIIGFAAIHAVGASIGSISIAFACMSIAPSRVTIVQSFSIIILLIIQYTVMRNGLFGRMNVLEGLGCLIILLSLLVSVISSWFQKSHEDCKGEP